jgi:N-acyl-D-amino-acid deacylase
MSSDVDLCLSNARIVDGTGAPWFRGTVAVRNGEITAVSRESDPDIAADREVDVGGNVVAPGFIDTHSHSDLQLFEDGTLPPKVRQGITTEIIGQDGFSIAPMHREGGAAEWQDQLAGLSGRVDHEWTWGRTSEYLDAIEDAGVAQNIGTLVGHGTVRYNVVGMDDGEPTQGELEEMQALLDEALEDGALGFSTALVIAPCSYGDTAELKALASRLEPYGRPFVAHIRSERGDIWGALDEFIDVGDDVDVPVHLSHTKLGGPPQHGKVDRMTAIFEAARDRGIDFSADQYPYTASNTTLSYVLPPWAHADGPDKTIEYLQDDDARERIRKDIEQYRIDGWDNPGAYSGWDNIVVANVQTDANEDLEGKSIAEIAAEWDTNPVYAVCDLLAEEELGVSIINHFIDEGDVREILAYDHVNVITDGIFGGSPHPRVYGAFAKVLGKYVRRENVLSLEDAVRKMTSLPARSMGLDSKGIVRPGMDADLVVLDPEVIESPATYENPKQHPKGLYHVLVDGEFVVEDEETTGATPGSAIRQ